MFTKWILNTSILEIRLMQISYRCQGQVKEFIGTSVKFSFFTVLLLFNVFYTRQLGAEGIDYDTF